MPIGARLIHAKSFPNRSPMIIYKEQKKNKEKKNIPLEKKNPSSLTWHNSKVQASVTELCQNFDGHLPLGYSTKTNDIGFHSELL